MMAKKVERYYIIANGRIIAEKNSFNEAVKHVHGMAWSFDVFDKIEIVLVVVNDAKKI